MLSNAESYDDFKSNVTTVLEGISEEMFRDYYSLRLMAYVDPKRSLLEMAILSKAWWLYFRIWNQYLASCHILCITEHGL